MGRVNETPLGPEKSQTKSTFVGLDFLFFIGKEGALVCYRKGRQGYSNGATSIQAQAPTFLTISKVPKWLRERDAFFLG